MSALVNVDGLIAWLKTMVKETGEILAGSVWPPLWLIVAVGPFASIGSAACEIAVVKGALLPATPVKMTLRGMLLPAATSVPPAVMVN